MWLDAIRLSVFSLAVIGSVPLHAEIKTETKSAPVAEAAVVPASAVKFRPYQISGRNPSESPVIKKLKPGSYGRVVVSAIVNTDGTLNDFVWNTSSGVAEIDAAVIEALKKWKLSPAKDRNGVPVRTIEEFPFELRGTPKRRANFLPDFPKAAKKAGHNGDVGGFAQLSQDGRYGDIQITNSSKSDILDGAVIAALKAYRVDPPLDLAGKPVSVKKSFLFHFDQAEGDSSLRYYNGLITYRCDVFVREADWWRTAHPGQDIKTEMGLAKFLILARVISPLSFGYQTDDSKETITLHNKAWDTALAACRANPQSTFIEQYQRR